MTAVVGDVESPGSEYLTEERLAIQAMAREFAAKEVLPVANELDPVKGDIPMELRRKMADLGFFGVLIPEEYGGLGLGVFEYAVIVEELARAWMSVSSLIARGQQFTAGFTEEQRRKYLPRMATGDFLSAFALSEPDAGSDVAALSTRASRDADGWRISGQKMWCTFADGADYLQVFARTAPLDREHRSRGISCFIMPKPRGELPEGVTGTPVRKIGYHGWRTWELSFDNAYAASDALVGPEGEGFKVAMGDLETARVHTAARAIGVARGALEDSIAYVQQRVQFGRPIGDNQAIRFKIAHMATEVEAARSLMYRVCAAVDAGKSSPVEASMVKYFATEMAERVTSEALHIHGGAGYTTDFAVERHWRDAKLTKIFEGTSEIQLKIISDSILGRPAR
ncbi:acyl-CoA dehydrogenase family protein [Rhodococcus oxybenzonivorans]|jgi:alkylation response protein AidB-like acyl-CoA dehydrogenase|uniref:acyl-CoA dehydrogenase family protein n=1 Tax=Rhodococcus TaxID=1827 RepID=UPI00131FE611|nr:MULTISPECIES: acyl-CoA dehydrogenase family protein [Rhodococcus]MDV7355193.1 acyl-CoA dehydrogenase family protein [Rhodococcus oxybenzonivorans]QHE70613.1 isobutyryl-CoA dehydrogenase [Rhodococcus sp. WAY2]